MIKQLFKRIWNDERGNALMVGGAALPLILGSAGLAVDTIQWTLWKRELQRAADSAAYAGVYAKAQNTNVATAITRDLVNNNRTGVTMLTGYPKLEYPTHVSYSNGVQVTLGIKQSLAFSSMFMATAPTIEAKATAAMVDDGEYCAGAEESTTTEGIKIDGGAKVNLGCKAYSASRSLSGAVQAGSAGYEFNSTGISAVGVLPSSITGTASAELKSYQLPIPDPLADKYSTVIPGTLACGSQTANTVSTVGGVTTLKPGCYTGGNAFKFTSGETVLQAGTYFLDSADFDVSGTGTKISGTGVTIILTGTSPGTIKITGGQVNLQAPTTGDYARMLFIQSSSASLNNNNTLAGNGSSTFDGAIYMPRGDITLSGGSAAATKCTMIWSRRIVFSGNANLQNNTTGCQAHMTVTGKIVRLVG
jgi:hypothetical protein